MRERLRATPGRTGWDGVSIRGFSTRLSGWKAFVCRRFGSSFCKRSREYDRIMDKDRNPFFTNLRCRECGRTYPKQAIHICEFDFGPLEATYDYAAIGRSITREQVAARPQTMWRYRELLPIDGEPTVGTQVGFTPLVRADRLARRLGLRELYIKNDTVNYPTLSFKDRVVSVALSARGNWVSRSSPARPRATSPTRSRPTPPPPG